LREVLCSGRKGWVVLFFLREEGSKIDDDENGGSFPLHPYYDILVHVPDTEEGTIKITYILITQKMREMIYKNTNPFLF